MGKGHDGCRQRSEKWRQDQCTAWIKRDEYGNRQSPFGWAIDHITPVTRGGSDNLGNLRPLQRANNAARQAYRLVCVVVSQGSKNVTKA